MQQAEQVAEVGARQQRERAGILPERLVRLLYFWLRRVVAAQSEGEEGQAVRAVGQERSRSNIRELQGQPVRPH